MVYRMAGPKTRPKARPGTADIEAADWHGRLGGRDVDASMIEAFFAWRQSPENAEAYRRVEAVWTGGADLAGDPQVEAALAAALSRKPRPGVRTRLFGGLAAVGAAAVLAGAFGFWLQARTVFSTGVGETRLLQLADGSSVRLDTASKVRVRFDGDRRLVELREGQAFFTVAHDAGRPFVVTAGDARVTALGTVFDVRRDAGAVRVTLVSGAVEVSGAGEALRMAQGQQARMSATGLAKTAVDVAAETGWTEGRIVFRDTPLPAAVAEVNRYLSHKILLDPAAASGRRINGVFRTGDREAFVAAAAQALGVRPVAEPDGGVRLTPASG
ncbi:fec operon regulator FecR [compost metagenome]